MCVYDAWRHGLDALALLALLETLHALEYLAVLGTGAYLLHNERDHALAP